MACGRRSGILASPRCIRSGVAEADIILTDALVNKAMLTLARPDARIIDAGKRGGRPSPSQDSISRRLISYARKGRRVLRLKGGDPFVFGRGGEEALALVRANIPFRIVPGVTAGIGGLAYAGIPVTHRDTNQAVTFITGSGANDAALISTGGSPNSHHRALWRANVERLRQLIAAGAIRTTGCHHQQCLARRADDDRDEVGRARRGGYCGRCSVSS
jgi:siroheme synthase